MYQEFKALSLSHTAAPVEIRELFHLSADACASLRKKIRDVLGIEELMLLSTCNRTEVYYTSGPDYSEELIKLMGIEKGIENPLAYKKYFRSMLDHQEASRYLFEISMGLGSQVLGDLQISNQVKQAYAQSSDMKMAGPFLHRLMHTIFHANKRVQQETSYRDGAASVSYAAAELAKDLVAVHDNPTALVIGLGEMGSDVARNLSNSRFTRVSLMNRDPEKTNQLARELGFDALPFSDLQTAMANHDVVLCAVAAEQAVITSGNLPEGRPFRGQFFIDLSVPRSIDPEVSKRPGLILYDIDEIRTRTEEVLNQRKSSIPQVLAIINHELSHFMEWSREFTISPAINQFKEVLEEIFDEVLVRYLKECDAETEADRLREFSQTVMHKIVKLPALSLRAACKRGEEGNLADGLLHLFDVEKTARKKV